MDLSTFAKLINAIAVTAGVIFAAVQIRHYRQRRRRDAMLELVRSFQSPAFASASLDSAVVDRRYSSASSAA
ncbi:MAG: hypothetical protein DME48_03465 [Verrucomicrobia bacterium]|nr:MAG: hypothetical protein DME48_03465 [Verrucomicrobiota bacterium]